MELTKEQILQYERMSLDVMMRSKQEKRDDAKISPLVGAVLVKPDGSVETAYRGELREGDHAEFTLIERKCRSERLDGAVLFATLEPCAPGSRHMPKLGCSERIVNARIAKVFVGIEDPDPTVDRKGIRYLEECGVQVEMYPKDLQDEIREANKDFLKLAIRRAEEAAHAPDIVLSVKEKAVSSAVLEDLSVDLLADFIKRAELDCEIGSQDFIRQMVQLGMLALDGGVAKPTGIGLLLFGNKPQLAFQNAVVRATYRTAGRKEEIFKVEGPLLRQPKKLYDWYSLRIGNQIDRSKAERVTIYDYPLEVINELVKNAVLHRDYDIDGAPVYFEIDDDFIVIKSPGSPVSPLTLSQVASFSAPSLSRNPKIMYAFDVFGMAEQRGLGFTTVRELSDKGIPLPQVTFDAPYIVFTLPRTDKAAAKTARFAGLQPIEVKGYEFILTSGRPISRAEYQEVMGVEERTAQRHLKAFVERKLVKQNGSGRGITYEAIE